MNYLSCIVFGVLPSFIWLCFYLRKDAHPEPKTLVLKIFFYGMLATIPAALLEIGILNGIGKLSLSPMVTIVLSTFLGVALIEEVSKYLAAKKGVFDNPELDEPTDVMLYMIIAALGFAALENILGLFKLGNSLPTNTLSFFPTSFDFWEQLFYTTLPFFFLRFLGATFLHTLSSGTLGFFLALSFLETKNRRRLLILGFLIAISLHGLFNLSLSNPDLIYSHLGIKIETEEGISYSIFLIPLIILITLAIFVSLAFKKLQKLKSVCKI
jgi:RsiW-degrading membrane proteinase PrsW (M82 family)